MLTTIRCRIVQFAGRIGRTFRPIRAQEVEEGVGAVFSVPLILRKHRLKKPMLIVDSSAEQWGKRLAHTLEENDISFAVWNKISSPPKADDGENIRLDWVGEKCDCFVALGGRDALDAARISAARVACRGKTILSMAGSKKIRGKIPPIIAIPSVAGGGAESLSIALVTDAYNGRFLIQSRKLIPAYVVSDPSLVENVPREHIAGAVMDGMCWAVEAYLSGYGNGSSRSAAARAIGNLLVAAEPCWNDGGTPEQRAMLLEASRLAGRAASIAGYGYIRALCRAAVTVTNAQFSNICSVILPVTLEKYEKSAEAKLSALAVRLGIAEEETPVEQTAALIDCIRGMAFRMGLPDTLEDVVLADHGKIAELAALDANPYCASPVVWGADGCAEVLRAADGRV